MWCPYRSVTGYGLNRTVTPLARQVRGAEVGQAQRDRPQRSGLDGPRFHGWFVPGRQAGFGEGFICGNGTLIGRAGSSCH